jgi:hypothetical protein
MTKGISVDEYMGDATAESEPSPIYPQCIDSVSKENPEEQALELDDLSQATKMI